MCRRKYILHYFGESFDEKGCNEMCDNCRHPKAKFEGKGYVQQLLKTVDAIKERLKAKEIVKIIIGESNTLIKQHKAESLEVYGQGTAKSKHFWHSVIRQAMVQKLLTKEIETYGIIKISEKGREFMINPTEFLLTEDHNYDEINAKNAASNNLKGDAATRCYLES